MTEPGIALSRIVVIGVSAGGLAAMKQLLAGLAADFPAPVLVVQHLLPEGDTQLPELLNTVSPMPVKEAEECEKVLNGHVYIAPPNYHMLLEKDASLVLSVDAPVSFARPSIDVLFESAAHSFGARVIGVVLTGANADGSAGLQCIKEAGGIAIVQTPEDAEVEAMPRAALARVAVDHIVPLAGMAALLSDLVAQPLVISNGATDA